MTLHQFTIFAAIAKHGNLTRASHEVHVTQPCISHQMRLLQQEYGTKLYQRIATGIELTDAGKQFLTAVSPILEQVQKLKPFSGPTTTEQEPGRLAIGGTHSTSTYLVPSLLSRFKKANQAVEIHFRTNHGVEIERLLLRHEIEIAVTTRASNSPRIIVEPFRRERLVTVVCRNHRLAKAQTISLRDIERTPFLIRSSGKHDGTTATRLKSFALENGIELVIGMRFDSSPAIKEAIHSNLGIGIIYEDVVRYNLRRGDFKAINIPGLKLEGQSYIIYGKDKPLSKTAIDFLDLLRSSQTIKGGRQNHPALPDNTRVSGTDAA